MEIDDLHLTNIKYVSNENKQIDLKSEIELTKKKQLNKIKPKVKKDFFEEYQFHPSLFLLSKMSYFELQRVNNFTIRNDWAEIKY